MITRILYMKTDRELRINYKKQIDNYKPKMHRLITELDEKKKKTLKVTWCKGTRKLYKKILFFYY